MRKLKLEQRTEILIEALPYIQNFRGHTFVIKYGGSAMENEKNVERLLRDIVFLEAVGINPVLVHGGGKAITGKLKEAGVKTEFVNGLRKTDEVAIKVVEEILDHHVNPRIVQQINDFNGQAKGFSGTTVFRAEKIAPVTDAKTGEETDIGFVGEVEDVNTVEIEKDIREEIVSVVSPLGKDGEGRVLNVNADIAASAIASALKATKLIYISDVPGIMRDQEQADSLIPSVTRAETAKLIEDGIIHGGMIPKVESACDAIGSGVEKVHFIDGRIQHGLLLEVFTAAGVGTEILP